MVKLTKNRAKVLGISLIVLAVSAFLGLNWLVYWGLSFLWTSYVSAILFTLQMILLIRKLCTIAVFPGSFWIWRRSMEQHFCKEMCNQLLNKICDLRLALEILLELATERDKLEFLPNANEICSSAKLTVATVLHSLTLQRENNTLHNNQDVLLTRLEDLKTAFEATWILVSNQEEVHFWDWIENTTDEQEWIHMVFEDFPHNGSAHTSLNACLEVIKLLEQSCGESGKKEKMRRWLFDKTLGSLDQMRVELANRFNGEQFWVDSTDKVKVDCMFIPTSPTIQHPCTMILCNPNAGYYEYVYYQSDWLDFYTSNGVNVVLWNYRGYGRSTGTPSPAKLKKDGEKICAYLRKYKKVGQLGAHGESLGGAVAAHMAKNCNLDFVFADRSFWSLTDVARNNFGFVAYMTLYCFTGWKADSSRDFVFSKCYKVVSSDPQDTLINDLASLKTGIAVKLLETQGQELAEGIQAPQLNLRKYHHILTRHDTKQMHKALQNLMKLIAFVMKTEGDKTPREAHMASMIASGITEIVGQSYASYEPLGQNTEMIDDEHISSILFRLFNLLDGLDAGGKPLTFIYGSKNKLLSLKCWLIVMEVYGSHMPDENFDISSNFRDNAIQKLRHATDEMEYICQDSEFLTSPAIVQICRDIGQLAFCLKSVLVYLEQHVPGAQTERASYDKAGNLIPLNCGHGGPFNEEEKDLYRYHLENAGFIERY